MALAVVWSQTALDDVEAIAAFPQIGRVVPELNQAHIRERFVYSYRLIYEIKPTQIEVLTIVHGRRLLEAV